MTSVLELLGRKFKIVTINTSRTLMEKVYNMYEHVGNVKQC